MKDHMLALRSWCKTAAAKIKYPPDRDAVTEELYGHAMDRYDDLINSGVSADEALRQTLAAMGDAQQLAPELAATVFSRICHHSRDKFGQAVYATVRLYDFNGVLIEENNLTVTYQLPSLS
jgi:hypothetical protein